MALGRTEPRRTHGTPPAVCPGLAAPATTSPERTPTRPPPPGPGGPRYNIAGAHPEQATHGGSGLAAPAPAPQWLLAGRSRAVPTARHPRCVPASRPPLQRSTIRRRRRAWPIGPGWEERTMPYDLVVKNGVV